jgi:hypothetical protein
VFSVKIMVLVDFPSSSSKSKKKERIKDRQTMIAVNPKGAALEP